MEKPGRRATCHARQREMATSRSSTHPAHRQPWIQAQYEERDSGCEIGGRKHRIPRPEHRRRHRSRGDELDGCVILMFDAQPGWAPTPAHLRVYVKTRKSRSILRLLCGAREVTRVTRSGFRAPRRGQPGQAEHGSSSSRNASNAFRRLDPGTVAMPGGGWSCGTVPPFVACLGTPSCPEGSPRTAGAPG